MLLGVVVIAFCFCFCGWFVLFCDFNNGVEILSFNKIEGGEGEVILENLSWVS